MKLTDLSTDFIIDNDTESEIIHLDYEDISGGTFYYKYRYLKYDFNGKKIKDSNDYIRVKSIWYINFSSRAKTEVVPFGEFDINEARVMGNYLYYTRITDRDNDGLLKNDYFRGQIYRVNLDNFHSEYCCDIEPYYFHGFEAATEEYIVFLSEDRIPDTSEIVFIDLKNKKKAVITNTWDEEEMDYKFIYDEGKNLRYIVIKKFVSEDSRGSEKDKLMCFEWDSFLKRLDWVELL